MSNPDRLRGQVWLKIRRQVLNRDGHTCQVCGHYDPTGDTLDVDHQVEIQDGGTDDLHNLLTLCEPCHVAKTNARARGRKAGTVFRGGEDTPAPPERSLSPGDDLTTAGALALSPGVGDVRQETAPEWAEVLYREGLPVPGESDTWPRIMTARHPEAVGSYGPAVCRFAEARQGRPLRWWQALVQHRALEHREDGSLVWEQVYKSTTRQVGKSWGAREGILWRLENGLDLFGNAEETVAYAANALDLAREIIRPAMAWAETEPGWKVRRTNGEQQIQHPNGSRWLVRADSSVGVGFTLTSAMLDEAWAIHPTVVDDQVAPALAEPDSAQLWLVSTAHPEATTLMPDKRREVLATLGEPDALLGMEWSASPGRENEDVEGWREASPLWTPKRQRFVASRFQGADPDSFAAQWLNRWPLSSALTLVDVDGWAAMAVPGLEPPAGVAVTVALDATKAGAYAITTGWLDDSGRVCLTSRQEASTIKALEVARGVCAARPGSSLVIGISIKDYVDPMTFPGAVVPAGTRETLAGTHGFQNLLVERQVRHDGSPMLATQITQAVVAMSERGPVLSTTRSPVPIDQAKTAVWVAWHLRTRQAEAPGIY